MCSLRTPTILLGFLLCCGALRAQYTQLVPTNGPNGARVAALVTDREGALYAGTYEGLYRSTDNGERWTRLRTAVDPVNVNALAVDSTNAIIAACENWGVQISTDRGTSWRRLGDWQYGARRVAVDADNRIMLGGYTDRGAIMRLSDDSTSWEIELELSGAHIQDLSFAPDGTALVASWRGCVYSRRRGGMWTYSALGLECREALAVRMLPGGAVLCGTECGLFRADSLGGAFRHVEGVLSDRIIYSIDVDRDTVIVGTTGFNLFRSTDRGRTWRELYEGLETPTIWTLMKSGGRVYCGTEQGVHVSRDNGTHWRAINDGLGMLDVRRLAVNSRGHLFAATPNGVHRTTDRGVTWRHINYRLDDHAVQEVFVDRRDRVWAGTRNGALYRSVDNGESWERLPYAHSTRWIEAIRTVGDGRVFLGTSSSEGSILRSTDDGATWDSLFTMHVTSMALTSGGDYLVGRYDDHGVGVLFTKAGAWGDRGLKEQKIYNVMVHGRRHYLTCDAYWSGLKHSDDASHWTGVPIEPTSLWGLAHDSSGHVLVGGVAVVHVVDDDDSVTSIRRGIEGRTVSSIVVAYDGTVYVGIQGGGVLRLSDSSDVSAAPADGAVCRDVLDVSAWASGGTLAVRMRSKPSTEASIELFTATGRSVARLDETTPATGVGILRMTLGDLPAGWYMLRVRCGERIATRPVIISE